MLYASRDRSYSMRRWWPQNWGVHDGHCWSVGDSAGEDRFCCGGAPARRDGVGHRRADLAVTGIWVMVQSLAVISAHRKPASSRATAVATTDLTFLRAARAAKRLERRVWAVQARAMVAGLAPWWR